jgi:hypothetical protein
MKIYKNSPRHDNIFRGKIISGRFNRKEFKNIFKIEFKNIL